MINKDEKLKSLEMMSKVFEDLTEEEISEIEKEIERKL